MIDGFFPFHGWQQFAYLLSLALIVYVIARLLHVQEPLIPTVIAWISGTISLAIMARGTAAFPLSVMDHLRSTLKAMRFSPEKDETIWRSRFPAWLQWTSSPILVRKQESMVTVEGPLSTLAFVSRRLRHKAFQTDL
ncbi:MAG TPA: hypothetical protein VGI20_14250 [Rhizomicrobium sp.]